MLLKFRVVNFTEFHNSMTLNFETEAKTIRLRPVCLEAKAKNHETEAETKTTIPWARLASRPEALTCVPSATTSSPLENKQIRRMIIRPVLYCIMYVTYGQSSHLHEQFLTNKLWPVTFGLSLRFVCFSHLGPGLFGLGFILCLLCCVFSHRYCRFGCQRQCSWLAA